MPALQREAISQVRVPDLAVEAGPAAELEPVAEQRREAEQAVADDEVVAAEQVRAEAAAEAARHLQTRTRKRSSLRSIRI